MIKCTGCGEEETERGKRFRCDGQRRTVYNCPMCIDRFNKIRDDPSTKARRERAIFDFICQSDVYFGVVTQYEVTQRFCFSPDDYRCLNEDDMKMMIEHHLFEVLGDKDGQLLVTKQNPIIFTDDDWVVRMKHHGDVLTVFKFHDRWFYHMLRPGVWGVIGHLPELGPVILALAVQIGKKFTEGVSIAKRFTHNENPTQLPAGSTIEMVVLWASIMQSDKWKKDTADGFVNPVVETDGTVRLVWSWSNNLREDGGYSTNIRVDDTHLISTLEQTVMHLMPKPDDD
jgi:hypothetical protein